MWFERVIPSPAMNAAAHKVLTDALELPDEDREALGWALLDSVQGAEDPATVDAAWREEIQQRITSLREGRASVSTWNEVEARLRAKVRAP